MKRQWQPTWPIFENEMPGICAGHAFADDEVAGMDVADHAPEDLHEKPRSGWTRASRGVSEEGYCENIFTRFAGTWQWRPGSQEAKIRIPAYLA
jgi:hypothetical protein